MTISSRFAVAIHILTLLEVNKNGVNSSEFIASSVNTHPVVIRRITGMLRNADLVNVHPGIAGAKPAKDLNDITLFDVYQAVKTKQEEDLFSLHENPNVLCPVGRNIQSSIGPIFSSAQFALETVLQKVTVQDVVAQIMKNE